jgi:hypothetical protein
MFNTDLKDDFEDKLRRFGEEADYIQGFQFIIDSFNAFSGLTQSCLNILSEEYSKKSIFSFLPFPKFSNQSEESKIMKQVNISLTLKSLVEENRDAIVYPLSIFDSIFDSNHLTLDLNNFDKIRFKTDLNYHSSSILATAIDSATLPWRQRSQLTYMSDIVSLFDEYKYKIVNLKSILPFNYEDDYLYDYLKSDESFSDQISLTPFCNQKNNSKSFLKTEGSMYSVCKGIKDDRVRK